MLQLVALIYCKYLGILTSKNWASRLNIGKYRYNNIIMVGTTTDIRQKLELGRSLIER